MLQAVGNSQPSQDFQWQWAVGAVSPAGTPQTATCASAQQSDFAAAAVAAVEATAPSRFFETKDPIQVLAENSLDVVKVPWYLLTPKTVGSPEEMACEHGHFGAELTDYLPRKNCLRD